VFHKNEIMTFGFGLLALEKPKIFLRNFFLQKLRLHVQIFFKSAADLLQRHSTNPSNPSVPHCRGNKLALAQMPRRSCRKLVEFFVEIYPLTAARLGSKVLICCADSMRLKRKPRKEMRGKN